MQRVVGLLPVLVCACLVAGCGGSALQTKARKVVGDPHATVVSSQTVDPLDGGLLTLVVMKPGGSQGLGCLTALGSGSSPPSGCLRWSDAYVMLGAKTHADMGDVGISKWQVAAIAKARSEHPQFAIFPSVNQLTVRCKVPNRGLGAVGSKLPGMCNTMALPFGGPVRCVAFITGWRPSAGAKMNTSAWVVSFDGNGHIESTRSVSDPPPPWNGHQPRTCSEIS
jgi:hypothetical protein